MIFRFQFIAQTTMVRKTYHSTAHKMWKRIARTCFGRLIESTVGTVEGRLVRCIHNITEREEGGAKAHCGTVDDRHDGLGVRDHETGELPVKME